MLQSILYNKTTRNNKCNNDKKHDKYGHRCAQMLTFEKDEELDMHKLLKTRFDNCSL